MFQRLYQQQQKAAGLSDSSTPSPACWPASYEGDLPSISLEHWHLEIIGLIEKPLRFSLEELLKLRQDSQNRRLISSEGWTYRSDWQGVLLQSLLDRAKPLPKANMIKQINLKGQTQTIPLSHAIQGRALLCHSEAGKTLSALYGGPLRLLVFDRPIEKGLCHLNTLEIIHEDIPITLPPRNGDYYAFDLKESRPVTGLGEITVY